MNLGKVKLRKVSLSTKQASSWAIPFIINSLSRAEEKRVVLSWPQTWVSQAQCTWTSRHTRALLLRVSQPCSNMPRSSYSPKSTSSFQSQKPSTDILSLEFRTAGFSSRLLHTSPPLLQDASSDFSDVWRFSQETPQEATSGCLILFYSFLCSRLTAALL